MHTNWEDAHDRFWRKRRRELALHIILFGLVNGYLLLFAPPALPVTTAPDFLRESLHLSNIPWLTIHWGIVLVVHVITVVAAALWEREFRRELDSEPAHDEKPKNRPQHLELIDDGDPIDDDVPDLYRGGISRYSERS